MENVLISYFKVESEAYQALSEMKKLAVTMPKTELILSQVGIFKKEDGAIRMKDAFDTGKVSSDDTLIGTLVGGLAGILAGPLGVLLGMGIGGTVGFITDAKDVRREASLLSTVTKHMEDGDVAIIAVVQERSERALDEVLGKFDAEILRYDASDAQEEVEHAKEVQKELERNARQQMADERSSHRKAKAEGYKQKIRDDFDKLKERLSRE